MRNPIWLVCITSMVLFFCAGSSDRKVELPPVADDGSYPAITSKDIKLEGIQLPPGFNISIYAEVDDARSMAQIGRAHV